MLIELGNHACVAAGIDERPKLTSIHIPESDEHGLGGYTHTPGAISPADFKAHLGESLLYAASAGAHPITRLPGHEALLAIAAAWPTQASGPPAWVHVHPHELTPDGHDADIEAFLSEFYDCPTAHEHFDCSDPDELLVRKELAYWTRTPPGELPAGLELPPATALYTNDGRSISNINDGGGQVGAVGQASAATTTTLTTGSTYTTNQWAGYRVYASVNATTMVWGNVVSNTNAANASVLTVDRWYAAATPGGAAGTTPSATATFVIADGGIVATWFVGLATGANAPAAADHTLATNGNAEITTAGGGLVRKIAPYAQTSGVAARAITLIPVFTANGSDTLPAVVTTIGVFASMVSTFGGAGGPMKFETALNASATFAAIGDAATITETVNGS